MSLKPHQLKAAKKHAEGVRNRSEDSIRFFAMIEKANPGLWPEYKKILDGAGGSDEVRKLNLQSDTSRLSSSQIKSAVKHGHLLARGEESSFYKASKTHGSAECRALVAVMDEVCGKVKKGELKEEPEAAMPLVTAAQ